MRIDGFRGNVLAPEDPGYDEARGVFNLAIDRRPAAVVRPADAADVARAVRFARERGLALTVRAGGHGFAGGAVADDAMVIDLARMRRVEIAAEARIGRAEGGVLAGEYTAAAGAHGLATGFGDTGSVGVAGIGFLVRRHGLTIDSLLAAEVVTAEGELVRADAENHPELFWALRGGGANLGVVTALEFRLHEVPRVVGGLLVFPARAETLEALVALATDAADELSVIAHVTLAPPAPFIPEAVRGRPVIMAMPVHCGDPAAGERALAAIRALAEPLADLTGEMPYARLFEEGGPPPGAFAVRSGFGQALDGALAERIVEHVSGSELHGAVQVRSLGGAVARVAPEATAFAHRQPQLLFVLGAISPERDRTPELERWVAGTRDLLGLEGSGAYANYLGGGDPGEAYPPAVAERLAAVRRRLDPDGAFADPLAGGSRPVPGLGP
jgi:FAD/FMN-containing dehydrogenase